jgi:hypothetical protein
MGIDGQVRPDLIPPTVVRAATGSSDAVLIGCDVKPITHGSGAATVGVARLIGRVRSGTREQRLTVIRKTCQPVTTGRHAIAAANPRHWAYWRREPLAYESAIVPTGPGLVAPRCYAVVDDVIYLQDVIGVAESPHLAARRLGAWQATAAIPDLPWLAGHQLAQRIALSNLDWARVDADPRLAAIWARRHELLAELRVVPNVLSHGDFHADNLVAAGDTTVVLDWGTIGVGPAGADLAHLALSALDDLFTDYLAGLAGCFDPALVRLGYRTTLALTAASRVHWMLSRDLALPVGYVDFVFGQLRDLAG